MSTHVMTGTLAHYPDGTRAPAVAPSEDRVCHLWAAQAQSHARHKAIYFSGATLYSYGSHYILGRIMPDGVVLLNADKNSVTTNKHRHSARLAVTHKESHFVPSLTEFLRDLDSFEGEKRRLAAYKRDGMDSDAPAIERQTLYVTSARNRLRSLIRDHASELEESAGRYLCRLIGLPAASFAKLLREHGAAERKAKAKAERVAKARALADAKQFADCEAIREFWPPDERSWTRDTQPGEIGYLAGGANGAYAQAEFGKRLARAHKASKAAGYTERTRKLWARLKEYRAYAAGKPARDKAAALAKLTAEFEAAREAGTLANLPAWRFRGEMAAEIEAAREGREAELAAQAYESWRETPTAVQRPDSRRYAEGSLERRVLEEFEREEAERLAAEFESWRRHNLNNDSRVFSIAKPDGGAFMGSGLVARYPDLMERLGGDPWRELLHGWTRQEAESRIAREQEAARLKAASEAEKLEAWRNGASLGSLGHIRLSDEQGGALLRIVGEGETAELETSHGAAVPLSHAIRAFRFVKLIRERGAEWHKNGKRVRVGHYEIDAIDSNGFKAGCHRINWPEIERAAIAAGVFDLPAADIAATQGESI